jgi:Flp pilus assembly protein TadD
LAKALQEINRAIEQDSSNAWFYDTRAKIYQKLGRSELARRDIEQSKTFIKE